jgi:hypothetical protein
VIEVVIGVLAAPVGALAVTAAAEDNQGLPGTKRTGTLTTVGADRLRSTHQTFPAPWNASAAPHMHANWLAHRPGLKVSVPEGPSSPVRTTLPVPSPVQHAEGAVFGDRHLEVLAMGGTPAAGRLEADLSL